MSFVLLAYRFRRRFTMKEGAHTSASQVIKLYDEDFKGQGFVSLHNFQVRLACEWSPSTNYAWFCL